LRFDRAAVTEGRSKPDFLFPGVQQYRDPDFDSVLLTMLGVKSTCKDRWRQVLAEAQRIRHKHLLTLETSISIHQTDEMQHQHLQLVVPQSLHPTYTDTQQAWLCDVRDFIERVRESQERAGIH
jgi:hypothetical protein